MASTSSDEIILRYNDAVLRQSDLVTLEGPKWLNDRIIEFYFSYLSSFYPSEHILLVPPAITYWIMNCPDTNSLKDFLKPLNLPSKKLIIFPVNDSDDVSRAEGGNHSGPDLAMGLKGDGPRAAQERGHHFTSPYKFTLEIIMLRRSQPSGAQNRKRKKNQQESERALHGSMDGFVIKTKKNNNSVAQNNDNVNVNIDNANPINNENPGNDEVNTSDDKENPINNENLENDEVNANEDETMMRLMLAKIMKILLKKITKTFKIVMLMDLITIFLILGGMNKTHANCLYNKLVPYMGAYSPKPNYFEYECGPLQDNGYDCGLYVLATTKVICDWFNSYLKEIGHLWFSLVCEQVNTSTVSGLCREILEVINSMRGERINDSE
ncbi:cysteine proteinases superfamily protein [Artemisia annua]|uniref:Cysteine proteinases superfamily protein n=1 Tax=Artemisia annua TaxID=35608 RepID=A0A2U1KN75_ARTAN|nr:cysteine proteinases superfamily protein [Artemisia annua]